MFIECQAALHRVVLTSDALQAGRRQCTELPDKAEMLLFVQVFQQCIRVVMSKFALSLGGLDNSCREVLMLKGLLLYLSLVPWRT